MAPCNEHWSNSCKVSLSFLIRLLYWWRNEDAIEFSVMLLSHKKRKHSKNEMPVSSGRGNLNWRAVFDFFVLFVDYLFHSFVPNFHQWTEPFYDYREQFRTISSPFFIHTYMEIWCFHCSGVCLWELFILKNELNSTKLYEIYIESTGKNSELPNLIQLDIVGLKYLQTKYEKNVILGL